MKRFTVITVALAAITLAGCANTSLSSGNVYTAGQARQMQAVTYGTLLSARPVRIQAGNENNIVGTVGGAVLGGLIGNTIGGGSGRNITTAAGAIAGGAAGNAIESRVNQTGGVELEIRRDSGDTVVVVQQGDISQFRVGQRLRIASSGSTTTVSPL